MKRRGPKLEGQYPRARHWRRDATTIVRDIVTARPKNEWPDDEFASEDMGLEEGAEALDTMDREWAQYYGTGKDWEPPELIFTSTPGRDGVPTVDDDLDRDPHAAPRSYPSWTSENSFVVSGTVGEGGRWKSRHEGRKYCKKKYGFIFEEMWLKGKVCFRVPKPEPKGTTDE